MDDPDAAFIAAIARFFREQRDAVARAIEAGTFVGIGDLPLPSEKVIGGEWVRRLAALLFDQSLPLFVQEGESLIQAVAGEAAGVSFDLRNRFVSAAMDQTRATLLAVADQINAETEDGIRRIMREGIDAGQSTQQIARDVRGRFNDISPARSVMIARTEAANARTMGQLAGARQSEQITGKVMGKRWLLAPNGCEFCVALSRKYPDLIPLSEPFLRGGESITGTMGGTYTAKLGDVAGPPLHPNDRCGLIFEAMT